MSPQRLSDSPPLRFKKSLSGRTTNFEIFGLYRREALKNSTLHRSYYGSDKTLMTELTLLGQFIFVPGIVFYNREHPDRSINISDKKVLAGWMDTRALSKHYLQNLQRLLHLIEIAFRHRDAVSPVKPLGIILLWALHPAQIGRCAAEVIGLVSPRATLATQGRSPSCRPDWKRRCLKAQVIELMHFSRSKSQVTAPRHVEINRSQHLSCYLIKRHPYWRRAITNYSNPAGTLTRCRTLHMQSTAR